MNPAPPAQRRLRRDKRFEKGRQLQVPNSIRCLSSNPMGGNSGGRTSCARSLLAREASYDCGSRPSTLCVTPAAHDNSRWIAETINVINEESYIPSVDGGPLSERSGHNLRAEMLLLNQSGT